MATKLKTARQKINRQGAASWGKLEQVFEDRVSRSLANLGVPDKQEFDMLKQRIDELSKAVATLSGQKADASKKAAQSVTGKSASKPGPRKNTAAKKTAPQPVRAKTAATKKLAARAAIK